MVNSFERHPGAPTQRTLGRAILLCPIALALLGVLGACNNDPEIIEVPAPVFRDPLDTVNNFLGYFDAADKMTACGNCHVGTQIVWEETGHVRAWAGLQSSSGAQTFCEGCHTVSERGNPVTGPAGYNLVADSQYIDVQCESCHGPGFDHANVPELDTPLAHMGVDNATGCGECHQGAHHPFVEQWEQSRHGTVPAQPTAISVGPFCLPCHEGKTALLAKFNDNGNYIEKFDGNPLAITCGVCHDPHGSGFDAQLRGRIDLATLDNFCVNCHARTGSPTPPTTRGPHAAQGFLVLGENVGWIPPGFGFDSLRIAGTHGTEANPRLCATCHVASFTVTDTAANFVFQSVGHTFEAIPCLDANGLPTSGPCSLSERDFESGCTASGCHGTAGAARSAFTVTKIRLEGLLDDLWTDTNQDSVIDPSPTDAGLLPQVVAQGDTSQLNPSNDTLTVAEGALWNAQLAYTVDRTHWSSGSVFGFSFSAHKTSGEGVHNPFMLEALLLSSISAVRDEYGIPAPISRREPQLTEPPGLARRR